MFYVYILTNKDNLLYIGATYNLKDTIKRHFLGFIPATRNHLPVKLVAYFAFANAQAACNFERFLQSTPGKSFIRKYQLI